MKKIKQEDCQVMCRDCNVCMVPRTKQTYEGGRRGWIVFYCPKCSATAVMDE